MSLTKTQARAIAQQCAFRFGGGQSYTPKTAEEAQTFEPHPWVLESMKAAALQALFGGFDGGATELYDRIQAVRLAAEELLAEADHPGSDGYTTIIALTSACAISLPSTIALAS